MANKTLQNTIDWVLPMVGFMPLNIGSNNEPAVTNANLIQQVITSPPFCWNWNRATTTLTTIAGTQDYAKTATDFGFLEKATLSDGTDIKEISIKTCLSLDSKSGRPEAISTQTDDGAGVLSFRLLKNPDKVYTVTLTYQKKLSAITALANSWAIPDQYQFIYSFGFLALSLLHSDDPRMPMFNQKFMSALLGANRGLSEMERNIFIGNWLALTRQEQGEAFKTQQAQAARAQ